MIVQRLRRWVSYQAQRLVNDYYFSNKSPLIGHIRQRHFDKCYEELRKIEPTLFGYVQDVMRSRGYADGPDGKYSDALFLLQFVRRHKPRRILECGAGASSVALAYALAEIADQTGEAVKLVSLEENADYLQQMVIPGFPSRLRDHVEFIVSKPAFYTYRNPAKGLMFEGVCYSDMPEGPFDMAYVDGPVVREAAYENLKLIASKSGKRFDADYVNHLLVADKPFVLVLDQRIDSRRKILSLLEGPVRHSYHHGSMKTVLMPGPHATRNVIKEPLQK